MNGQYRGKQKYRKQVGTVVSIIREERTIDVKTHGSRKIWQVKRSLTDQPTSEVGPFDSALKRQDRMNLVLENEMHFHLTLISLNGHAFMSHARCVN